MKSQEKIIIRSIVHIVDAIAARMMETAFGLAYEGELAELKVYRAPKIYPEEGEEIELSCLDSEIELLDSIADEGVKTVVASMKEVQEFKRVYLLINNLDLIEVLLDEECADLAVEIYEETPIDLTVDYENQKAFETDNYFLYNLALWRCIKMLETNQISFDEDKDWDLFSIHQFDFFLNNTTSEDKNVALLYDLQRTLEIGMIGRDSW
jgi:hypothetical protein